MQGKIFALRNLYMRGNNTIHFHYACTLKYHLIVISPFGSRRLKFVPKSVGAYLLRTPSDVDIQVKNVYDASLVKVMQPEPAVAGQPSSLLIDTGGAGTGALSVSMRAAGYDVEHSIRELEGNNSSTGRFEVSFVPRVPAPHRLEVRFNGAPVVSGPGARPIELPVRDPVAGRAVTAAGNGLYQARVGKQTNFVIDTLGRKTSTFDVVVTGPPDAMPPYEAVPIRYGAIINSLRREKNSHPLSFSPQVLPAKGRKPSGRVPDLRRRRAQDRGVGGRPPHPRGSIPLQLIRSIGGPSLGAAAKAEEAQHWSSRPVPGTFAPAYFFSAWFIITLLVCRLIAALPAEATSTSP